MSQENEDEELLKIFVEEARDLLDAVSLSLQHWSSDLSNKSWFSELKRDLHTLKGGARMVSQTALSALAHELESLCEALLTSKIPSDRNVYDLVCAAHDRMQLIVDALAVKKPLPETEDLMLLFRGKMAADAASATAGLALGSKQESEKASDEPKIEPSLESSNELIRIKSELLEKLNNLSIENNILRVNLVHHIDKIKPNMGEAIRLIKLLQEKLQIQLKGAGVHSVSEVLGLMEVCKEVSQIHVNAESLLSQQSRVGLELQERLIDTRMVAFSSVIPRLSRIVRQVAGELKKKIDFNVLQAEGEVDRNLLDHIIPSLEHLLRNALDHGIEPVDMRLKLNKPEAGKINLRFFRMGNEACIEIGDDGSGVNLEAVRKKATRLGLLPLDAVCSDEEALRFIFEPGFSTRDQISEISGRGVGMDVVNTVVKALGGNLAIESRVGLGTKFIIRVPFTTSINRALLVGVQSQVFGILLSSVESIVLLSAKQVKEALNKNEAIVYNKKDYHLKYLGEALGIQERPSIPNTKESLPVLFFNFSDYNAALLVDSLIGSQEVVVQTLGPQFKLMDSFSGGTLLADGRVLVILDAYAITAKARRNMSGMMEMRSEANKQSTVLVVDDSITIRTVTKNFLEQHKYIIITAKDGFDALGKVAEDKPDIILLDLEMPRMDGFQFVEKLKADSNFAAIPIIMITFCTSDEDKAHAKKLGINRFINKPYKEPELLEAIEQLLERE